MNFFEQQARAQRSSRRFAWLFAVAVLAVSLAIGLVALLVALVAQWAVADGYYAFALTPADRLHLLLGAAAATAAIILLATAWRLLQSRSGGSAIALQLGARPLPVDATSPRYRRLRNVVEEIAIASGVPVPEIFVLEKEQGINAFAAGFTPSDAVVAVTRGALEKLSRDELQGVIAHEFSHILNGDMRLNLRLMGLLFGLMIVALLGLKVIEVGIEGDDWRAALALGLVGGSVLAVGWSGFFAGELLQAAVSRSRERLADASAVQFTRQTAGLADALKKIMAAGSRFEASAADDVAHMLFASGVARRLLATHPPIEERIRAVEPGFDPAGIPALAEALRRPDYDPMRAPAAGVAGFSGGAGAPAVQRVGQPDAGDIAHAGALRAALPEALVHAAHDPEGAETLVCALLLDDPVRARQLDDVQQVLGGDRRGEVERLAEVTATLAPGARLPLALMAFPVLRNLPGSHADSLVRLIAKLSAADGNTTIFEYGLGRLLRTLLADARRPGRARIAGQQDLASCRGAIETLLSTVARLGHADAAAAQRAFSSGARGMPLRAALRYEPAADWTAALDQALDRLDRLKLSETPPLIAALERTICSDRQVTVEESELLRVVCGALHCPLPPLVHAA